MTVRFETLASQTRATRTPPRPRRLKQVGVEGVGVDVGVEVEEVGVKTTDRPINPNPLIARSPSSRGYANWAT